MPISGQLPQSFAWQRVYFRGNLECTRMSFFVSVVTRGPGTQNHEDVV